MDGISSALHLRLKAYWEIFVGSLPHFFIIKCGASAVKGKGVCRFHGGKSTGPKADEGRKRCGIAKTVHGGETRAIRAKRAQKMAELKELVKMLGEY